jgi:hypothetical protein
MALSESPMQEARREFDSEVCAVCGKEKKPKQGFCTRCYFTLPQDLRGGLMARFGSGFEGNYQEAKDWLRQERKAAESK